jgi:hypothetical protein
MIDIHSSIPLSDNTKEKFYNNAVENPFIMTLGSGGGSSQPIESDFPTKTNFANNQSNLYDNDNNNNNYNNNNLVNNNNEDKNFNDYNNNNINRDNNKMNKRDINNDNNLMTDPKNTHSNENNTSSNSKNSKKKQTPRFENTHQNNENYNKNRNNNNNNIPNQIKENKLNNLDLIKDERTGITLIEGKIYDDFIKKGPKKKKEVKNFTKKYNGKVDPVQLNTFYHNNNFKKRKKKKKKRNR